MIVRAGRSLNAFSLAIVRQAQGMGAYAPNPADALAKAGEPLALRQTLAMAGVPVPDAAVSHADLLREKRSDSHVLADALGQLASGPLLRFAVIGGRALAVIERPSATALEDSPAWRRSEIDGEALTTARGLAERAARAVGLGLAAVDVAPTRAGPMVADITASMSLAEFERLTGAALIEAVIVRLEQETQARLRV